MATKRVSNLDVARAAGVSPTTVSHVLSGNRPVSEQAAARVRAAIDELGYRPHELARSLRTQRSLTLGLVVPDITNPFNMHIARGLQQAVLDQGYFVLVTDSAADADAEHALIDRLLTRVDAIAFSGHYDHTDELRDVLARGLPVVWLGGWERAHEGFDTATTDDYGIGVHGTEHLIGRGYRRIAFLATREESGPGHRRVQAYRDVCAAKGLPIEPSLVLHDEVTKEAGAEGVRALMGLAEPPDAIIATNDIVALGALSELLREGVDVPGQVALMGVDDIDAASLTTPTLTSIPLNGLAQGRAIGRLLLERIAGNAAPTDLVFPAADVVQREST
ncbi:LacI family DNA-binding transcriptional regulator [Occultella kanbiaonis]|uniref:LacI family DNA-binding transcriptional regulator n=1 Tax=Occultella kanbiaonis TaxID=2675754 RepID=UPI0013D7F5BE|nr:LacI family DNA-binding transcriptional regulator [Occultella kanbiaonis]